MTKSLLKSAMAPATPGSLIFEAERGHVGVLEDEADADRPDVERAQVVPPAPRHRPGPVVPAQAPALRRGEPVQGRAVPVEELGPDRTLVGRPLVEDQLATPESDWPR